MRTLWSAAAISMLVIGCREGSRDQAPVPEQNPGAAAQSPPEPAQPVTGQAPQPGAASPASPQQGAAASQAGTGAVLSCGPGTEVEETVTRLIEMADVNGDGKVSRGEAQATTSFLVGGFFFRADADGNGVVTPDEGRQARAELMSQHPQVASLLRTVRTATGESPFAAVARLVDVDYGKPLTIAEARDAARGAVSDLYSVADANRDGVITVAEARTSAWEGARSLGRAAFQAADSDRSGALSRQELQAALQASANTVFRLSDTNGDDQLSEDEAAAAMGRLGRLAGVQTRARE